ncbi:MAG: hypothetical protein ABW136_08285 [Steroidobacteraceae bacterium]
MPADASALCQWTAGDSTGNRSTTSSRGSSTVTSRAPTNCTLSSSSPVHHAISYADCINTVPFGIGLDTLSKLRLYYAADRQVIYVTPVN